jgi:molybdopterin-guanine dinucleotide biosynthesis protein
MLPAIHLSRYAAKYNLQVVEGFKKGEIVGVTFRNSKNERIFIPEDLILESLGIKKESSNI